MSSLKRRYERHGGEIEDNGRNKETDNSNNANLSLGFANKVSQTLIQIIANAQRESQTKFSKLHELK